MKTILLTGGAGFVGSWVAEYLIKNGHKVVVIDDLSGGKIENVPDGAEFVLGDITDEKTIDELFDRIHFDVIAHFAAFASENLSNHVPLHTHRSIVIGTQILINAAVNHGIGLFVNTSSIAVYGAGGPPFDEEMIPMPIDIYGAAKVCAETCFKVAHRHFGLNSVIFRPHNLIGTRQNMADSTRNVASIFIRQALSGQPLPIFGDGTQTRAWSPIEKVAKVIAASIDRPKIWNHTYNIGGDQVMTVDRLADLIIDMTGSIAGKIYLPDRNEVKHAYSNHQRARTAFPDFLNEEINPAYCISEMIEEARKQPFLPLQSLPAIEIHKNLPEIWKS